MLWIGFFFAFCLLIFRELLGRLPISKTYLSLLIILALLSAWPPYHHWRLERFFTHVAQILSENSKTQVHCNTLFDTLFDEEIRVLGHADPKTAYIVMQYPLCDTLANYIKHPLNPDTEELISLSVLTHESMHARGEYNEAKTECEAVQRNYRSGILLGIPDSIAKQNAVNYYNTLFLNRRDRYFSKECVQGGTLDEHLSDSIWN